MATRTASARMRLRISRVNVPTPGPYSTRTRALSQSTRDIRSYTRNGELGTTEPSMNGYFRKLRANSVTADIVIVKFDFSGARPDIQCGPRKRLRSMQSSILDEVGQIGR